VFRNLDILGAPLPPNETDAVSIVDPDAMLAVTVAGQRFQTVAGRNQKIGKRVAAIESNEAPERYRGDAGKFPNPLAPEEPLGLPALEASDHNRS
jgi:hypothetical protein